MLPSFSYNSFTKVLNNLIMPTNVHNVHQQWIHEENMRMALSGFLNAAEALGLKTGVGTSMLIPFDHNILHLQLLFANSGQLFLISRDSILGREKIQTSSSTMILY